jgi:hypothetical protein
MDSELDRQDPFPLWLAPSDTVILDRIQYVIINLYNKEYEPFTIDELRIIVDSIVEIVAERV